jgi:predicted dehydrogenase
LDDVLELTGMTVRLGLIGTSWWADAMYMPPLSRHPGVSVAAVCGRNPDTTAAFAERWAIGEHFTDPSAMLDSVELDALIIASGNEATTKSRWPLDRRLHDV